MNTRQAGPVSRMKRFQMETVMRMRPLLKKERDDFVVLEPQSDSQVILNPFDQSSSQSPPRSGMRGRTNSDSTANNVPTEYHFNHVLTENTSQDKIYYTLGLPIVTATMNSLKNGTSNRNPETHLLISMGIENSGKTYTCFGGMTIPKRRASQDGLVPRLLDSLFSQSSHAGGNSKGFTVQISMMQVTELNGGPDSCQIHDLLANQSSSSKSKVFGISPMKKKNLNVRNMAARFERAIPSPVGRKAPKSSEESAILDAEDLKPMVQNCRDITQAREFLQSGLQASQRNVTGNQKSHLYITMQPVVDGTRYGDRISILDMAGLEKENSMRNTRGKESAATTNPSEAGNDAVLTCLRVLTQNAKIAHGKSIPFQRHKVTMLLNPIFSKSSFVKVTLLFAAYPGHADFQQKRMLLKDIEMLHGSSLAESAPAATKDEIEHHTRSNVTNPNKPRAIEEHEGTTNGIAPFNEQRNQMQGPGTSSYAAPSAPRMPKAVSVYSSRKSNSPAKPGAPRLGRGEPVHLSRGLNSYAKAEAQTIPHKPVDLTPSEHRRSMAPSAPVLSEFENSYKESREARETAMDFPGLQLPSRVGREAEMTRYAAATRTHYAGEDERERPMARVEEERRSENYRFDGSVTKASEAKMQYGISEQGDLKSPLGRSRLENSEYSTHSGRTGKTQDHVPTMGSNMHSGRARDRESNAFEADFANFERETVTRMDDRVEEKLRKALQDKESLERICAQLEKENAELKKARRESGRKALQSQWTDQDEEEFLASRRMRQEAQNKIKAPIHEHLARVNYIYDIKNQWCMTNKRHFSLSFPETFQRAPELDVRDRNNEDENVDTFNIPAKENHKPDEGIVKKWSPPRRTPPKKAKSPAGLAALRKLAAGRKLKY